jgi:hypothetical protein
MFEIDENTDGGNHLTHYWRHRFHNGSNDVGIKTSGNRSHQKCESGKGSYRDTAIHEIQKPQHICIASPYGNWTLNIHDVGISKSWIP